VPVSARTWGFKSPLAHHEGRRSSGLTGGPEPIGPMATAETTELATATPAAHVRDRRAEDQAGMRARPARGLVRHTAAEVQFARIWKGMPKSVVGR
jgi:hypothetical protein